MLHRDNCRVCKREIQPNAKGNNVFYDNYCSKYCFLFHKRNLKMINGAEKHGKKQYEGFNYWPKIIVPCDTCAGEVSLSHCKHRDDRVFCSRSCYLEVKTCRKNANRDYTILRILRDRRDWLSMQELSYIFSCQAQHRSKPNALAGVLRRWVSRGIVEKTIGDPRYRLNPKYLDEAIGALVIKYQTPRPYAQSMSLSA